MSWMRVTSMAAGLFGALAAAIVFMNGSSPSWLLFALTAACIADGLGVAEPWEARLRARAAA